LLLVLFFRNKGRADLTLVVTARTLFTGRAALPEEEAAEGKARAVA
jgi:hypothetical protein